MKDKVKKVAKKFLESSPSTKVLFMFIAAIMLSALAYSIFVILIAK